jgi:hypothetical protein
VLEWVTGANDAGVYDVEVTSPTASDSPGYGVMLLKASTDTSRYIAAVEAADGEPLEPAVKAAITAYIDKIKTSPTLWDAARILAPMAGPRTLAGALVPLKQGDIPFVGTNLTSTAYDRRRGILMESTVPTRIDFSGVGYAPDPINMEIWLAELLTEPVVATVWIQTLGQDNWPSRSILTFETSTDGYQFDVGGENAVVRLFGITYGPNQYFMVSRPNAAMTRERVAGESRNRDTSLFAPQDSRSFNIREFTGARYMCVSVGLTTTEADEELLETAAQEYRIALAAALPGK